MGASSLFSAYEQSLPPQKSDTDTAMSRAVSCVVALNDHYYGAGTATDRMTLIGSVAKDTSVKPLNDIDVVFHMPGGTWAKYNGYAGNGQSALLQDVRGVLAKRYPSTKIKGDGPVVVVQFTTGASVEIVPAVLHEGADILHVDCQVPVTRAGGGWEAANYGAQFDAFSALNNSRSEQLSRLIRYMKRWRKEHFALLKSVVLELMAIDFLSTWDPPHSRITHTYDDWLVRDFLEYIVAHQDTVYSLAGTGKRIETGFGWRNDASNSARDAQTACSQTEGSAEYISYWRRVLGDDFGK